MKRFNYVVNLTPHSVVVHGVYGDHGDEFAPVVLEPSGTVARLAVVRMPVGEACLAINDGGGVVCTVYQTVFDDVQDLPAPQDGTAYVVSALVMNACPERNDLLCPGEAVRDTGGRVVGCRGLCSR